MTTHRFTRPPRSLRRRTVKLDNIVLVPASLLPFKKQWQALANNLPDGSVLLCSRMTNPRQRNLVARIATQLKSRGHLVTTLAAERFARNVRL